MRPQTVRASAFIVIAFILAAAPGCRRPDKPARGAHGEFALEATDVSLTWPSYHAPLDTWVARHSPEVEGRRRSKYQCVLCHDPERHCNQCHRYMGLHRRIMLPAAPASTLTTDAIHR